MASRFGHVGINIKKKPDNNYQITEFPSNLEIISMENPKNIKPISFTGLSEFDYAKFEILIKYPKLILKYPKYFDKQIVDSAKRNLMN